MKNLYFAIFFLLLSFSMSAQWEPVYQITSNNIYEVYARDKQHVFLGTEKGDLYKSDDAGMSFEVKDLEPHGFIYAIDFEDELIGYAGGGCYFPFDECPGNTFYITEDGGNTWEQLHGELLLGVYTDIEAIGNGKLFTTNEFYGLEYSDDGGSSLYSVSVDGTLTNPRYEHLQFLNDQIGYVGVINFNSALDISHYIFKTTDGGDTWIPIFENSNNNYENGGFYFTDEEHGFVLGQNGNLWRTTDGGDNWTALQYGASNEIGRDITFPSSTVGYIASHATDFSVGRVYRSTDGGQSWALDLEQDSTFFDYLSFADDENGFAASYYTTVYRRSGANNTAQQSPTYQVDIFPNPAEEYIELESNLIAGKYRLVLHDMLGRTIISTAIENSKTRILTGDLANGVYILQLFDDREKQVWVGKMIKH